MDKGLVELGQKIAARRKELRLSQEELAARGGPSTTTVSRLEIGEGKRPQRETLEKLDRSLDWAPGTAGSTLYYSDTTQLIDSSACDLTAGVREVLDAAQKLVQAFQRIKNFEQVNFELLDNRTRVFGLCWLLGREIGDIDLLTERDADELISTVKAVFMQKGHELQTSKEAYFDAELPHGFTRAEVDRELQFGGSVTDAIERLMIEREDDSYA